MGCSAAAFTTSLDAEGWDPLAAAPSDPPTRDRAARAAGVRLDEVAPPFDEDMRALVLERIAEAIDTRLPPLVRATRPDGVEVIGNRMLLGRKLAEEEKDGHGDHHDAEREEDELEEDRLGGLFWDVSHLGERTQTPMLQPGENLPRAIGRLAE